MKRPQISLRMQRRLGGRLSAGAIVIAGMLASGSAILAQTRDDVIPPEAINAMARLESHLRHLQGSIVVNDGMDPAERWDFRFCKEWFVLTHHRQKPAVVQITSGRNSRYDFTISRPSATDPYRLHSTNSHPETSMMLLMTGVLGPSILAPVCVCGKTFSEWRKSPTFKVLSLSQQPASEGVLVNIECEYTTNEDTKPGNWPAFRAQVICDPKSSWAIKEQRITIQRRHQGRVAVTVLLEGSVTYGEPIDGLPVPAVVTEKLYANNNYNGEPIYKRVITLNGVKKSSPEEYEFSLSAFGLPEPPGVEWPRPTPWYLWLVGIGIACIVGAVAVRWLKNRVAPQEG